MKHLPSILEKVRTAIGWIGLAWFSSCFPLTAQPVLSGSTDNPPADFQLQARQIAAGAVRLQWPALPIIPGYRVEFRDTWTGSAWMPCPPEHQWPYLGHEWADPRPTVTGGRFYRVATWTTATLTRGRVLSATLARSYTTQELRDLLSTSAPQNGVVVYQVVYETMRANGEPTTASGAFIVPKGLEHPVPLLSYQHGTTILKTDVPSQFNTEYVVGLALAATGYAVAMPDYLGLGQSPGFHPYMHARSAALAVVDMLRAARTLAADQQQALNEQLFLMGYSEGGQATMAAHWELEACHRQEFPITASAPMAGPHDLSGVMANAILSDKAYDSPYYLPYTLFALNDVYGFYTDISQVLVEPYATTLPPLFDGRHGSGSINAILPVVPHLILKPEFLRAFQNNPAHPLRVALRNNDLYHWTPRALMRLYHCRGDTTVPFANSQVAYDHFRALGATQVQLIDPFPPGNHSSGAIFCITQAKAWFDELKQ